MAKAFSRDADQQKLGTYGRNYKNKLLQRRRN
jgi:hypothetical protein